MQAENVVVKGRKKRGRKSKKELQLLEKQKKEEEKKKRVPKKRGRKPKGGKIINSVDLVINTDNEVKQNVILHLKCRSTNISDDFNFISDLKYDPSVTSVKPYDDTMDNNFSNINEYNIAPSNEITSLQNNAAMDLPKNVDIQCSNRATCNDGECVSTINNKELWAKLRILQTRLIYNNVSDKKSDCFWCTYGFNNPPIFIPKQQINNNYKVYGCFCSPECAVAYLCNENIDSSTKWERYSLLNSIYTGIYDYTKNIKPAPDPHYLLDKFYGNMTIDEYRKLCTNNKLLLVVDKPITRVLPELHEETNEYDINIGAATTKKNKYKLKRTKPVVNKNHKSIFNITR